MQISTIIIESSREIPEEAKVELPCDTGYISKGI
jgi:hypothetical protein